MGELSDTLKTFFEKFERTIFFDVYYIVGGIMFIASALDLFNSLSMKYLDKWYYVIFGILISWLIGFAIQEILTQFGVVRTLYKNRPLRWTKNLIRRHGGYPLADDNIFPENGSFNLASHLPALSKKLAEDPFTSKQLDRIINLKHAGSTIGANLLVTGIILLIAWIGNAGGDWHDFHLWIGLSSLVFAFIFIIINRVKLYQQYQIEFSLIGKKSAT